MTIPRDTHLLWHNVVW